MAGALPWLLFLTLVSVLLGLDLGVFNRRPHAMSLRAAATWSVFWVSLSLTFNAGIYWRYGSEPALQFLTSYLLEKSLSVDNVFLFAVIFTSMGVAAEYQHRVLFWGVFGGIVARGIAILAGVQLVRHFHFILYIFAALLLVMGARMLRPHEKKYDPDSSRIVKFARRLFPISDQYESGRFFTRCHGRLCATPLLLVLIIIEVVDVTFAMDSLPAIFAVTQDAFIIFTSNILAILGLRSLYFLLAGAMARFRYLNIALAVILIFIGGKMLTAAWIKIPTGYALLAILAILTIAVLASMRAGKMSSRLVSR
jgi:tellurite resistance protein TerC